MKPQETPDGVTEIDTAGMPDIETLAVDCMTIEDVPDFDPAEAEIDVTVRLKADRSFKHSPRRRLFNDYRSHPDAYKHLQDLPGDGESLHGIISGKYALWEMVPAIIERNGQAIADLTIATLSFSKANAADLLGLLDDGHVTRVGLLISYFFKAQNRPIYDSLVPQLRERGHKVLAMRTHCKIILARMADGTRYTVESSANLRSSVNIEQFVITQDRGLYEFHHDWMRGELLSGIEEGK